MFKVTIECANLEDLQKLVNQLSGESSTTRVVMPEAVTEAVTATPEKTAAEPVKEPEAPLASIGEVTYSDVKDAVLTVAKLKGRPATLALLEPFGVVFEKNGNKEAKLSDLKPEQYFDVVQAAKALAL